MVAAPERPPSVLMAGTLAWNPIRAIVGSSAARAKAPDVAPVASLPEAPARKKRRVKGDFNEAAGDLALSLEPSPDEMPAIEASTPLTVVDERVSSADASGGKKRKKSKAEVAADHDAEIVAAIESTAHPDVAGEELPSPELLAPVPPRNSDASKRELDAMGGEGRALACGESLLALLASPQQIAATWAEAALEVADELQRLAVEQLVLAGNRLGSDLGAHAARRP